MKMDHKEQDTGIERLLSLDSSCSSLGETASDRNIDASNNPLPIKEHADKLSARQVSSNEIFSNRNPLPSIDEHMDALLSTKGGDKEDHSVGLLSLNSSISSLGSIPPGLTAHKADGKNNKTRIPTNDDRARTSKGEFQSTSYRSKIRSAEQAGRVPSSKLQKQAKVKGGETNMAESILGKDEKLWVCDFCRTAVFSDIMKAQNHENLCRYTQKEASSINVGSRVRQSEILPDRSAVHQYFEEPWGKSTRQQHYRSLQKTSIGEMKTNLTPRLSLLPTEIPRLEATEARDDVNKRESLSHDSCRRDYGSFKRVDAPENKMHSSQRLHPSLDGVGNRRHVTYKDGHQIPGRSQSNQWSRLSSLTIDCRTSAEKDNQLRTMRQPYEKHSSSRVSSVTFDCRKISEKQPPLMTNQQKKVRQDYPHRMKLPTKNTTSRLPTLSSPSFYCQHISEKEQDMKRQQYTRSEMKSTAKDSANQRSRLSSLTVDCQKIPKKDGRMKQQQDSSLPIYLLSDDLTNHRLSSLTPFDAPKSHLQTISKQSEEENKRWICDSCKAAKFESYVECYIHEKGCSTRKVNVLDTRKRTCNREKGYAKDL
jgi:hypothetical protein